MKYMIASMATFGVALAFLAIIYRIAWGNISKRAELVWEYWLTIIAVVFVSHIPIMSFYWIWSAIL